MKERLVNPVDLGKTGEVAAEWFLKSIGARCVHKLETPSIVRNGKKVYTKTTPCDFVALIPMQIDDKKDFFIASRVEVKLCDSNKLNHSRLDNNQVDDLTEWSKCGKWSFILWVHKQRFILFKYPTIHFRENTSLSLKTAEKIAWKKN